MKSEVGSTGRNPWCPRTLWEKRAVLGLPGSVLSRLGGGCETLQEAEICCKVALMSSGVSGALLAALHCYVVPVQVHDIGVHDILDMVISSSDLRRDNLTTGLRGQVISKREIIKVVNREGWLARYKQKISDLGSSPTGLAVTGVRPSIVTKGDDGFQSLYDLEDAFAKGRSVAGLRNDRKVVLDPVQNGHFKRAYNDLLHLMMTRELSQAEGWHGHLSSHALALEWCNEGMSGSAIIRAAVREVTERKSAVTISDVVSLLKHMVDPVLRSSLILESIANGTIDDRKIFPIKDHPGASTKVNIRLGDVLNDIRTYQANHWSDICTLACTLYGCYNDEATGWIMWYVAALDTDREMAFKVGSIRHINEAVKEVSNIVKAVGQNCSLSGAILCELTTLRGRGVSAAIADVDVISRINKKRFLRDKAASFDLDTLRKAIREVVADELVTAPKWPDKDDYWTRRWAYTKSGSHTRGIEDVIFGERLDLPDRPTRREFSEAVKMNLVAQGTPLVLAGFSQKLEHSKSRPIYGCDSRSYFTFDYLLRPVEAVWKNKRALLDPGQRAQFLLYPDLAKEGPYRYMLDFDDYNSQHTLDAMKMVIEEVCAGAPNDVLQWAVASWDNMYVRWLSESSGELRKEKMVGTLPSGHRATTFVNTILNAAYCRIIAGSSYCKVSALHAGDDVIMSGTQEDINHIVHAVEKSVIRVNRDKQSVGSRSGEFLRVAFNSSGAYGYLARAIASCVSGNWVTEKKVAPRSYLDNFVRMAWTLSNRSGMRNFGALLVSSFKRQLPTLSHRAYEIVTNRVSVGGSPVMAEHPSEWTRLDIVGGTYKKKNSKKEVPSFATDDYLSSHVDFKLLKEAGVSPGQLKALMLRASYKPDESPEVETIRAAETLCPPACVQGVSTAIHFVNRRYKSFDTAIKLLQGLFSSIDWTFLLARLRGVDPSRLSTSGEMEWPVGSKGGISYSDCASLRHKLTRPTLMLTSYKIFV